MNYKKVAQYNSPEMMAKTILALRQELAERISDMSQAWALLTMESTQFDIDNLTDQHLVRIIDKLSLWSPPPCPRCGADNMTHKLFSHVPDCSEFRNKNGWYCDSCHAGPFQLGSVTESDAAVFSLRLLNL